MDEPRDRAISDVLDKLEETVHDNAISVREIMEHLGQKSFAALILVPALIAVSPASAIPGLTSVVALIVALMVVQMLWGRKQAWLPEFLAKRRIPSQRVCQATGWLRRPVEFVERFLRPRLSFLIKRPWIFLPLIVCLAITFVMPFLEVIPMSGSIASAAIALFAAAMLTRDGVLLLLALGVVLVIPVLIWQFGF